MAFAFQPSRKCIQRILGQAGGIILSLAIGLSGCTSTTEAGDSLVVFAAASLGDALKELAIRFESESGGHRRVALNTGASGKLAAQLKAGAPCDVFIPADVSYLQTLSESASIDAKTRTWLAANQLVVIVPGTRKEQWRDAMPLVHDSIVKLAVANPDHAPAGNYARQALTKLELWDRLKPRIIFADDVRFAARYVAENAVDAGIVYATDAAAFESKLSIVYRFRPEQHDAIDYEGALCSRSQQSVQAKEFLRFIASPKCRDIWEKHGFLTTRVEQTKENE